MLLKTADKFLIFFHRNGDPWYANRKRKDNSP